LHGFPGFVAEVQRAGVSAESAWGDKPVEVADEHVFEGVPEADVDVMSFEDELPLVVRKKHNGNDRAKRKQCVPGVNRCEHGDDFFYIERGENIDQDDNADDGQELFEFHSRGLGTVSILLLITLLMMSVVLKVDCEITKGYYFSPSFSSPLQNTNRGMGLVF